MSGTTNFQAWDAALVNIADDATYAASSLRANGYPTGAIVPGDILNKFSLQASIFPAAFCEMLAAKGFSTSDSNQSVLAGVLANILTTADQRAALVSAPPGSNIALDAGVANGFFINLSGTSITVSSIANLSPGQIITFMYLQDATGGRTVTMPNPPIFNFTQPDPAPNAFSLQLYEFAGSSFAGAFLRPITPLMSDNGTWLSGIVHASSLSVSGNASIGGTANISGIVTTPEAHITEVNASDITAFTIEVSTLATLTAVLISGNANVGSLQIGGGAPSGQALVGDGTNFVPTPLPSINLVVSDVTGSRSFGTNYTNTSGREVDVYPSYISTASPGNDSEMRLYMGPNAGSMFEVTNTGVTNGPGTRGSTMRVPNGWVYSATITGSNVAKYIWCEGVYV